MTASNNMQKSIKNSTATNDFDIDRAARAKAIMEWTIIRNEYVPHDPTPKQAEFLLLDEKEALFGGAAGGGKSDALLMAALQYVDYPGYAAILFRRTFADLALPGALMDRMAEWLAGKNARWHDKSKTWIFPSGATISFGYLEHEKDKFRYQGAEFQFIGFDELTHFTMSQYTYLFSRLRRLKGAKVPLRMRTASNPGGVGHEWVKQRFLIEGLKEHRPFVPSTIDDNPYLDREEYVISLQELDPLTRSQLLSGDWDASTKGNKFRREWFPIVSTAPSECNWIRYWDLAATEPKPGTDPDYTAGALVGELDGVFYIQDIRRTRSSPQGVEKLIQQTAETDGRNVSIYMEQEPGSSGVNTIDHYRRRVLKGWDFRGHKSTGSKEVRANPVSSAAEAGNVKLVQGDWIGDFLNEAEVFATVSASHDDQVDAVSGAFGLLNVSAKPDIF